MTNDDPDKTDGTASPAYALGQAVRAFFHGTELALARAEKWRQVVSLMLGGRLKIGSRTPLEGIPAWVTLEVLHGGFASGNLAASGPLQPYEKELLERIEGRGRLELNLHFASPEGRAELVELLENRCYRISVPEEAGLMVAAWLSARGEDEAAQQLVSTLLPLFDRLRFYPRPFGRPLERSSGVHVITVGQAVRSLERQRVQLQVEAQREAVTVWAPMEDRAVALFCETVEGELPSQRRGEREDGQPVVFGGWPCRLYPEGWAKRADELLSDYKKAREQHRLCSKPDRPKENFARLRHYLSVCVDDPSRLTGRDVGWIRKILAAHTTRWGIDPVASRTRQAREVRNTSYVQVAEDLATALKKLYAEEGGAPRLTERLDTALPKSLQKKALRCWQARPETLIGHGIVTSSEALAGVLDQMTARVKADALSDESLRPLYESLYRAFRQRRSLLLLNYQSQARFEELPMIVALTPWLGGDEASEDAARLVLEQVASLALRHFPQTQLPNKLITELRALAKEAGASQPFVEELAADIFMGGFSPSYLHAAKNAATLLKGTLYAKYYDLPYEELAGWNSVAGVKRLSEWCQKRVSGSWGSDIARNGAVIEQAQILTTHNLATLFSPVGLLPVLQDSLPGMARTCFEEICQRMSRPIPVWRAQMQTVKNSAYAWRQMIFYLSFCTQEQQDAWRAWANQRFGEAKNERFRNRFLPALRGLEAVMDGGEPSSQGRLFLGWSATRHWLLEN